MFIDLEIRLLYLCVFFLSPFFCSFFVCSPSSCLFSFNLANKRRIHKKYDKKEHFTCSLSTLYLCRALLLIGLHVSITRKSFTLNRQCRWGLPTLLAYSSPKKRFDFFFCPSVLSYAVPSSIDGNVCRSELWAKIVCHLSFCRYLVNFPGSLVYEQVSGWACIIQRTVSFCDDKQQHLKIYVQLTSSKHKLFILRLLPADTWNTHKQYFHIICIYSHCVIRNVGVFVSEWNQKEAYKRQTHAPMPL